MNGLPRPQLIEAGARFQLSRPVEIRRRIFWRTFPALHLNLGGRSVACTQYALRKQWCRRTCNLRVCRAYSRVHFATFDFSIVAYIIMLITLTRPIRLSITSSLATSSARARTSAKVQVGYACTYGLRHQL